MRLLLQMLGVILALTTIPALNAAAAGNRGADTSGRASATATDAAVTSGVRARLANDRLLKGATVAVDAIGGVVTLSGSVPADTAHTEARDVARGTPGVVAVKDDLRIDVAAPEAPAPP